MKRKSKIEKVVNKFYFGKRNETKTTGELDKRIINDALPEYEQSLKTHSAEKQPNIWRIIMRNKIVKLAAAAVILLAIILGINLTGTSIDGASTAFAAAIDTIKNARTFSCIVITDGLYDDNGTPKKFQYKNKIMFKKPDLERSEELASPWPGEEGKTTITNYSKKQILTIIPAEKTAELQYVKDGSELNTSIREWLIQQSLGTFDDLGDVELNGQTVHKIRSTEKVLVYTIWIDPKTNYPVQVELKLPEQNFIPILYTSIKIDTEIDDKLFSFEPPEGYDFKIKDAADNTDFQNMTSGSSSPGSSGKQKAFLSINDILDKWEAGYSSIHSMKVKYTMDTSLPDPNGKETILHTTVETIQDGKKFYYKSISTNPDLRRSEEYREGAYDGEISTSYKYYEYNLPSPIMYGEIAKEDSESAELGNDNNLANYMMLSRYYLNHEYPDGETYFAFWIRSYLNASREDNKFTVIVRPELETILGEPCHVVEAGYGNEVKRFWMAHNKGLLVMKYENYDKIGQLTENKMEVLKIASVMTDKGEVWYPCEIKNVNIDTAIKLGTVQTHECKVQEFVPYITDISPDTFRVKFPVGTRITDKVKGITYVQTDSGNN